MRKFARNFFVAALTSVFGCFYFFPVALADTMSSANYVIQADSLNAGGGYGTSASFISESTIGEPATGEDASSASFFACAGYQCFIGTPYISFSVKAGTSSPGTSGAPVSLGTITTSAVTTSDGSTTNSIFLTAENNAQGGAQVQVKDANSGLQRVSSPSSRIDSATATLVPGTAGYGVCVFSSTQHADSPSGFNSTAPYNGSCGKVSGHAVGGVATTPASMISSVGPVKGGAAEVLLKAAISSTTPGGNDYQDTLTFIYTGTY